MLLSLSRRLGGAASRRCFSSNSFTEELKQRFNDSTRFEARDVKWLLGSAIDLQKQGPSSVRTANQALRSLVDYYTQQLPKHNRAEFFRVVSTEFGTQEEEVQRDVEQWERVKGNPSTPGARIRVLDALARSTQPLYASLFLPLSRLPGEIIEVEPNAFYLQALNNHLRHRLAEWFNVGLLQLDQLTWDKSSAAMLEKIQKYEAIHPISNWEDLKPRLGNNRRVFAFFHPRSDNQSSVTNPTVGVFYSISATCPGLTGIDLGTSLVKEVALKLLAEFPSIKKLVTLSPVPQFKPWLVGKLSNTFSSENISHYLLSEAESSWLLRHSLESKNGREALLSLINNPRLLDQDCFGGLESILIRLAKHYLTVEKRRNLALDPVARFHLRNGASLLNVNWRADTSSKRMQESLGIMVNYLYPLEIVQS